MDDLPKQSGKRSTGGCFIVAGVVGVLLLLVPIIGLVVWSRVSKSRLEQQLSAMRERGEPTSAEELDQFYVAAEGPDTTALLLAAMEPLTQPQFTLDAANLPIVGNSDLVIPPPGQEWAELAESERLLEKYAPAMLQLHEATGQGAAARFDLQFADGLAMELKHAQDLTQAARMLALEAHVRAHRGDASGTADSIVALFTLARSLETEPVLVSYLVRIALSGMALNLTNEFLPHVAFSDADLRRLQETFRAADFRAQLRRGFIGEQVFAIQVYRDPGSLPELDNSRLPLAGRNEDLSLYLELMEPLVNGDDLEWSDLRKTSEQSTQTLKSLMNSPLQRLRYLFTSMLFPSTESVVYAAARITAHRDATDALLAVERYRREHGKTPTALGDLVPEFLPAAPQDPFDGKPLRYRLEDQQVVIYSIGRDEVDNGGVGDKTLEPDIVVRLPLHGEASP